MSVLRALCLAALSALAMAGPEMNRQKNGDAKIKHFVRGYGSQVSLKEAWSRDNTPHQKSLLLLLTTLGRQPHRAHTAAVPAARRV